MPPKHNKIKEDDPSLIPSDSEDEDFTLDNVDDHDSSTSDSDQELVDDDGRPLKKRKKDESQQKEPELTKADVDDLWASFNSEPSPYANSATLSSTANTGNTITTKPKPKSKIKITVNYEFAGEVVEQEKEVDEDSEEAKKWLATRLPKRDATGGTKQSGGDSTALQPDKIDTTIRNSTTSSSTSGNGSAADTQLSTKDRHDPSASTTISKSLSTPSSTGAPKRPKSGGLNALAAQLKKPSKLNTLEKSKLDWNKFVSKEDGLADTLTQARKSGYLDKQDFLSRTEQAKDDQWEQAKSTRRR
ncbi:hypothetical protein OIO90_005869 [Microbotryomycetes sp. JL221]|nr:hypothetical protein OIO90_005869 [Microbotryomycetes sp. JL221]